MEVCLMPIGGALRQLGIYAAWPGLTVGPIPAGLCETMISTMRYRGNAEPTNKTQ